MHIISHTKNFSCSFHSQTQVLSSSQLPHASYRMNSFMYMEHYFAMDCIGNIFIDGKNNLNGKFLSESEVGFEERISASAGPLDTSEEKLGFLWMNEYFLTI